MKTQIRARLGTMMFLEYFVWGVWYVTLGTWLGQHLHFSGKEIGLAAGTTALGAMLSPFLVGLMADEWFATQRLLAALHGVGGMVGALLTGVFSYGTIATDLNGDGIPDVATANAADSNVTVLMSTSH